MKLRNLFFALLALPLAFVACEPAPEPEPQPEPKPEPGVNTPVLTLTSNDVLDFEAEGGVGFIRYTLENAVEGVELDATCEANWVTDLVAGDNVVFKVVANEGEARTTKVVVSYDTQSFEVTVNQAAKGSDTTAPAINITSQNPMTFDHNEQMGSITYTIDNPIEGVNLTASANASWISQVTVDATNSEVVFMVGYNSGDEREAVVTLTYGMLEEKVTIKQSEWVALQPVINVASSVEIEAEGGAQSIDFTIDNPAEGVSLTATCDAEWITNLAVTGGAITFEAAANESNMREAKIVLTYADVTATVAVIQRPANAEEGFVYSSYGMVSFRAECATTTGWMLIMSETDTMLGEMFTRIYIELPEANPMYITDGHYTVANGGVLVNTTYNNSYSTYRYNSTSADIVDADIEVTNDLQRHTTTIKGTFTVGNEIISFQYRGEVSGFMYEEIGEEGITNWTSFTTKWLFDDCYKIEAKADGVTISLSVHELGASKSNHGTCPSVGEYVVANWMSTTEYNYIENTSSFGIINSNDLSSGTLTVADAGNGQTTISFDLIDDKGTQWKGSYTGAL